MTMRAYLLTTIAALVLVGCAAAQANPDSIKVGNNCRLAAKVIANGHPAPHEAWAFGYIGNCPAEAGAAIASGMRSTRTSIDTSLLNNLTYSTSFIHDAAVLDAALEVAADPASSFEARIFSLRSLYWLLQSHPSYLGFGSIVGMGPYHGTPRCWVNSATDTYILPGTTPLPPDYRDRIRVLASSLEADTTEAGDIRNIAGCLKYS